MKQNKGFTILEMVITVFIVSFAIVGIYSALFLMVILNESSIDAFQAAYLSQEGAEIIRNIRDTNWLVSVAEGNNEENFSDWVSNIMDECRADGAGCQLDYTTGNVDGNPLVAFDEDILYVDTEGFYSYTQEEDSNETKFSRRITTEFIDNTDCPADLDNCAIKVIVETFWDEKPNIVNPSGMQQSIRVEEILYNWY